MIYYSAAHNAFYDSKLHSELPSDAILIEDDRHRSLLDGQANGQRIVPDADGRPVLVDPVATE